jgi:hypothetical protein
MAIPSAGSPATAVASGLQEARIPLALDAHGNQFELERARHLRGGFDDEAIAAVIAKSGDEGPVELQ